ncbi:RelA/SpoT domain-containing protein [Flavobacterium yafengii]|uniref:RelA/SpoT domain-containing protein n=1 Tax=Flavobacterium yafengii TaxID=3041253 RepID=UPI0024A99E2F|nr:RelA/SpoT domain-containing protein [Flavobacterium yafengii]MDI5897403.1 RelA/SpoT domain-containing protein [Flavobacterium yafengii]
MRKYSNNEIKKAGKILAKPLEFSTQEYEDAQNTLTYWRTIHAPAINTFQATLRDKLKRYGFKDYLIAQRLKRAVSIVSKLERFSAMKLSTMQDIAGLRAILKNIDQVRNLENSYRTSNFNHLLVDDKDYISKPAISGYRGIHLVYEYVNPKNSEANGLKIELQIRTKLQHTWATAVETMGTFLNHSLKSSQGPGDWLEYFALISAGFAILEKSPVPLQFSGLSEKEIFQKIIDDSITLDVSSKLRAFSVAGEHIAQNGVNSKYNLITLNLEKRVVNVKNYSARQLEQANIDYTNIEKEINKGAQIQAVLVSTDSIESLRKTYPSYFLDSHEFLNKLNLIYSRLQKI